MLDLETHAVALAFFVPGTPQTAGSKRGFVNPKTGGVIITESGTSSAKAAKKTWRGDLRDAAAMAIAAIERDADEWPTRAPLAVQFSFVRVRPASHYGSGRNASGLKPSAPAFPITRPDVLKTARAAEDALTSVLWHDDAQIVDERITKAFGPVEGVDVVVTLL